jgi:hypothetical protein
MGTWSYYYLSQPERLVTAATFHFNGRIRIWQDDVLDEPNGPSYYYEVERGISRTLRKSQQTIEKAVKDSVIRLVVTAVPTADN